MTASQISQLDNFLSTHTASPTGGVQPNTQSCNFHQESYLQINNQFQSVPPYKLGILPNSNLDPLNLLTNYGFNNLVTSFAAAPNYCTTNPNDYTKYKHDSVMISLPFDVTQSQINDNGNQAYKYYFIDEPFDRLLQNSIFLNIASCVYQKNPYALFLFSEWYWPQNDVWCYPHSDNGNTIFTYWFPNSQIRIMCDEYDGNGCGDVHAFWSEFKTYYGQPNRNQTNWISMKPNYSLDWPVLLGLAMTWYNGWGACNPIWVYAGDGNVDYSVVLSFCNDAWQAGMLLRSEQQVTVYYQCSGNCTVCNWPSGNWTPYAYFYGPIQWVHY
jgi:hypothetical protein